MIPQFRILVACFTLIVLGQGSPVNSSAKGSQEKGKSKRQFELGDVYHHSDLDLFHTGLLLASQQHYPSLGDYGEGRAIYSTFGGEQPFHFHPSYLSEEQRNVHQQQNDIPTSPPRNPKRPVYHYTPLPRGTFPDPPKEYYDHKKNEDTETSNLQHAQRPSNYLFGYRVNDASSALEMGRQEKLEDNILQGYYHVLLPDQRVQIVQYWSDFTGFHPSISYA